MEKYTLSNSQGEVFLKTEKAAKKIEYFKDD